MANKAMKRQDFLDDLVDLNLTPEQRKIARKLLQPDEYLVLVYHPGNSSYCPKIIKKQERELYKDSYPKIIKELSYTQI